MMLCVLCVFLFVSLFGATEPRLQCRDEADNPVDWYVLYKLPRQRDSDNKLIKDGVAYTFITSNNVSLGWMLSTFSINDSQSIPGRTLSPLYPKLHHEHLEPDILRILYNDEPPPSMREQGFLQGHTKGVVMSQSDGGFWLVHSVPHFPPLALEELSTNKVDHVGEYSYPHTGVIYGQSFLCISLGLENLDLVGVQLLYNQPDIYDSYVPKNLESVIPHLVAAARNTTIHAAPWNHQVQLTTLAGQQFQSFAKSAGFNKELYADWVAAALQSNLLVESWPNGQGRLPSNCTTVYKVQNIAAVKIVPADVTFTTHRDHSKWAVTRDSASAPWVCVGDINRMASQKQRGGGTVCLMHPDLWDAYRSIVWGMEPCPAGEYGSNK